VIVRIVRVASERSAAVSTLVLPSTRRKEQTMLNPRRNVAANVDRRRTV
jgi:hypothetical protein